MIGWVLFHKVVESNDDQLKDLIQPPIFYSRQTRKNLFPPSYLSINIVESIGWKYI